MKKKEMVGHFLKKYESIFICPVCSQSMRVVDLKSLVCPSNHTFDLAKQGYINMLTHPLTTHYDKELFESRKIIAENGFFDPVNNLISDFIKNDVHFRQEEIKILDTGCGEGSHLHTIKQKISPHFKEVVGAGIDIAKEGIMTAAKNHLNVIWCVADLAHSPFKNHTFDLILNILSPANYGEFDRLLTNNGLVIKVMPQSNYLKELRQFFFEKDEKQQYSNKNTIERFHANFDTIEKFQLEYQFPFNENLIVPLLRMTPLTWSAAENKIEEFIKMNVTEITIAFDIVVGRRKQ